MGKLGVIALLVLAACKDPPVPAAPPVAAVPVAAKVQVAPPEIAQAAQAQAVQIAMAAGGTVTDGFVAVPAGTFVMGEKSAPSLPGEPAEEGGYNDSTPHSVTITRAFEIRATEVTVAAYKAAGVIPEKQPTECGDCPVLEVTWFHAAEYCNILSRKAKYGACYTGTGKDFAYGGPNCRGYRLPTEAEWEYAARAGDPAVRYGEVDEIAWYDLNAGLVPHAAKGKKPNAWGLYDMLGNAREWVYDWKADFAATAATDPQGPATGENRVFRGGDYKFPSTESRAAFRNAMGPLNRNEFTGFRCARTL